MYICGLEHSGTTLLSHLLGRHPDVLALGEVRSFFSPDHLTEYLKQWGHLPDSRLCSCGRPWNGCPFWAGLVSLNGVASDRPLIEKYGLLFEHVRRSGISVVVDSSKTLPTLERIVDHREELGLSESELFVIHQVKDVRSFATSIAEKEGRVSIPSLLRTFNWWADQTRRFLDLKRNLPFPSATVLYETLCQDPIRVIASLLGTLGIEVTSGDALGSTGPHSHIVMGNKDFLGRERSVRYDQRWFQSDKVLVAYLLHRNARRLNRELYARFGLGSASSLPKTFGPVDTHRPLP